MRLNDHKQTNAGIVATMLPWLLISIAALTIGTVIAVQLHSAIDNTVSLRSALERLMILRNN